MEWIENAGWVYDKESDSLERVDLKDPIFTMFISGFFMLLLPLTFWEISSVNGPEGFTRIIGMLLVIAVCGLVVSLLAILYHDKAEVRRIGLSDLNYTTMDRSKRTLKNSNVKVLKSEEEFTHENLEVIVVRCEYMDYVSYDVRLVRKDIIGNERVFTYQPNRIGDNKGTLPAELQVSEGDLFQNKNIGLGHHLQRRFTPNYQMSEYGATVLSEHLRQFFIDGGWKQLSQNSNLRNLGENPEPTKGVFWESSSS